MVSNHSPAVSVVVPCFNHGRYLRQAIDSALAQTSVRVEVIVVNDGSTDDTADILDEYPDVVAVHQANSGLAAARNAGMAIATGEYLCLVDADDRLGPTFAAELIAVCRAKESEFAFCDFLRMDESGAVTGTHAFGFGWPVAQNITQYLMYGGLFPPVCVLGRRDQFTSLPMGMDGHADYALWLDVSLSGKRFAHLSKPLVFYRESPTSMSADRLHMDLSWQSALAYAAERHPGPFFAAIQGLQKEHNAILHLAKRAAAVSLRRDWPMLLCDALRDVTTRVRRKP